VRLISHGRLGPRSAQVLCNIGDHARAARILDVVMDPTPQDLPGGQLLDFRKQIILAQYLVKLALRLQFRRFVGS
jgi:hypothetical protein